MGNSFVEPPWPSDEAETRALLAAHREVLLALLEQLVRDGTLGWDRAAAIMRAAAAAASPLRGTGQEHPMDRHATSTIMWMEEELFRRIVPRDEQGNPAI